MSVLSEAASRREGDLWSKVRRLQIRCEEAEDARDDATDEVRRGEKGGGGVNQSASGESLCDRVRNSVPFSPRRKS